METTTHEFPLQARTPFDFGKSLSFLCSFPPTRGEQQVGESWFRKALLVDGEPVAIEVTERCASITASRALSAEALASVRARIAFMLGLDDDLAGFYEVARRDRAFAPLVDRLFGQRHVKFGSGPFEAACWAVLTQRVPIARARTIKDALVECHGRSISLRGRTMHAFPNPAMLEAAGIQALDRIVRHPQKSAALLEIARAFAAVDERFLLEGAYDEVDAWLQSLPRIGPWSSAFVLFRALGRMERMPTGVKPLADAARKLYALPRESDREVLARGDAYGPHRGYWSYYLRVGVG